MKNLVIMIGLWGWFGLLLMGCNKMEEPGSIGPIGGNGGQQISLEIETDKSRYETGESVEFRIKGQIPSSLKVSYTHLGDVVHEADVIENTWTWQPPQEDFKGYLVEFTIEKGEEREVVGAIAVDVSSDWTRFPRYGFVSKFPAMTDGEINKVVDNLTRHRINGIQFYDWHYKHHQPLAGTPEQPVQVYKDIINRDIHFSTVKKYIDAFHAKGTKAMFYNLIYGAMKQAGNDGVSPEWYLFKDRHKQDKDYHGLPQPPFTSDIYVMHPGNKGWVDYMVSENEKVYQALPFDGFHMDQLGDRGTLYDYEGNQVPLQDTFGSFVNEMKEGHPDKKVVLNAVNQFGKEGISRSESDFLYTEVWGPNERYSDLAQIIMGNSALSEGSKNTVLAAYMNYELADHSGHFNTPGVLLTEAVIFAFGGAHIELGEHMLGKEYFPNNNLEMKKDLQERLVRYYDFMTAYQNLLRDGGAFNQPQIDGVGQVSFSQWPPQIGDVSIIGKDLGDKQIIHLINFQKAAHLDWRDNQGNQPFPPQINNIRLGYQAPKQVKKIWMASPDSHYGAPVALPFTQKGNHVSFTLPSLLFWDMVVFEFES